MQAKQVEAREQLMDVELGERIDEAGQARGESGDVCLDSAARCLDPQVAARPTRQQAALDRPVDGSARDFRRSKAQELERAGDQ